MTTSDLHKILKHRILILDGAMGTMIQQNNFSEEDYRGTRFKNWGQPLQGNNDLLSLTQPRAISHIHRKYLEAGADLIETNTFSSTTIGMEDYGMGDLVDEINIVSAQLAKKACEEFTAKTPDKPRFVVGSMGPTNRTASLSPDVNDPGYRAVTFEDLRSAYYQQAKALIQGGADILMVETIFDTLNAKAALFAIEELKEDLEQDIPVMASGTITDASGRTLSGQTTEAFLISIEHMNLLSIGLNCALGAQQLAPYLEIIANQTDFPVSAHPNAGLPNAFGEYDETPQETANYIENYLEKGLINIIGGCCGTTPEHIKAIADKVQNHIPRNF